MKTIRFRHYLGAGTLAMMACAMVPPALAKDDQTILNAKCMACHTPEGDDKLSRISHQRKTPEGWLMSIVRMQIMYGVKVDEDDRRTLVKYLADKQGLAPSETEGMRYALERRLNTVEEFDEPINQTCGRCHSGARVALQRRPLKEWEHLVDFHLGRWPSLEYQAMSRDRDWFGQAKKDVAPLLAERYPLDSKAWSDWQQAKPKAETLVGKWSFAGNMPSKGEVAGTMQVTGGEGDQFKVAVDGQYADGTPFQGQGSAVLYSGYEWRASVDIGGVAMRQVFAASKGQLHGRMFETEHDERGLDFTAAQQGTPRVLAVQPGYLKVGAQAQVDIIGSDLKGVPTFAPGIEVLEVLAQTPERISVKVKAGADAAAGVQAVRVGAVEGGNLAVYRDIAEVKVVPAFSVARVGDNGGSTPKVQGRLDAEAWGRDAAGKPYRIGIFPASWSVAPFDERAAEDEDVKYAGIMHKDGVFLPGDAGPNPARKMSTNNAGNLKVIAQVDDGGTPRQGEGQLIVTVQRWNNPPIP